MAKNKQNRPAVAPAEVVVEGEVTEEVVEEEVTEELPEDAIAEAAGPDENADVELPVEELLPPVVNSTPPVEPPKVTVSSAQTQDKMDHLFERWIEELKGHQPVLAAKTLNAVYKQMYKEQSNKCYDKVVALFKENSTVVSINTVMGISAVLPPREKTRLEVLSTIFLILAAGEKLKMDLGHANRYIENDHLYQWLVRKK